MKPSESDGVKKLSTCLCRKSNPDRSAQGPCLNSGERSWQHCDWSAFVPLGKQHTEPGEKTEGLGLTQISDRNE